MLLLWLIMAVVCGIIGNSMGAKRSIGAHNGALIGLLLGFLGLVIMLFMPVKKDNIDSGQVSNTSSDSTTLAMSTTALDDYVVDQPDAHKDNKVTDRNSAEELTKWFELKKSGAITDEEYQCQKNKILQTDKSY